MSIQKIRDSLKRCREETGGQVLVLFLIVAAVLVMLIGAVYNVGDAVGQKMRLQNLSDSCAYSEAIWTARSYNFMAYVNRAHIAHFCTIHFCAAVDSAEKLWKDFADTLGNIPYIGPVIKAIHGAYQAIDTVFNGGDDDNDMMIPKLLKNSYLNETYGYPLIQKTFFNSMRTSLILSDIPDDIVRTTENLCDEDHDIEVNDLNMASLGLGGSFYSEIEDLLGMNIPTLGFINESNYSAIVEHDGMNFKSDFNKLKSIIESSLDAMAEDSYFPRHFLIYIPPKWLGPLPGTTRTGLRASHSTKTNQFKQKDGFTAQVFASIKVLGIEIGFGWQGPTWWRSSTFDYDLDEFKYPFLKKPDDGSDPSRRSIWTVLKKPKTSILQFPVLLGMREPEDIHVISRAEVYYKNPENAGQKPTLFNPFWHARLAPVYDSNLKYTTTEKAMFTKLQQDGLVGGSWADFIMNGGLPKNVHH